MSLVQVTAYDTDSQEAEIEITVPLCVNGSKNHEKFVVKAFCHPFRYPSNESSTVMHGLCVENILIEKSMQAPEKTGGGYFSYRLTAQVVDKSIQHVKLGEYDFFLDNPLPKDIENNSYISFDVLRIDVSFNNTDKG